MNAPTKVITAHLPMDLADKVEAMALRLDRSRGWIMKQALAAWVDGEEERHRMTLEALADVDAGRLVDHSDMVAWADSLGTEKQLPPPSLMIIRWTSRAAADLARLQAFLHGVAPDAAVRIVRDLARAPDRLLDYPRIGEKLDAYDPREVRRIIVGRYEMRYELARGEVIILRVWHSREDRPLRAVSHPRVMLFATASATLMPSIAAERMPPA